MMEGMSMRVKQNLFVPSSNPAQQAAPSCLFQTPPPVSKEILCVYIRVEVAGAETPCWDPSAWDPSAGTLTSSNDDSVQLLLSRHDDRSGAKRSDPTGR